MCGLQHLPHDPEIPDQRFTLGPKVIVRFIRCVSREIVQGTARSLIDHYIMFGPDRPCNRL